MLTLAEGIETIPVDGVALQRMPRGAIRRCWLTVPVGLQAPIQLPAMVVRGDRPGPTALFVAGVHGDEFEGVAALPALIKRLEPAGLRGTVIAILVCNPFAFDAGSRTSPSYLDGANLAREFPGDPDGNPTQRLAAALFDLATRLLGPEDLLVDLHSAGAQYQYLALAGYRDFDTPARAASEEAARHFASGSGAKLWSIWPQRGMFNSETTLAGIPTVACEAPGQGGCRATDVFNYVNGLLNLLRYKTMIAGVATRVDGAGSCPTELKAAADGILVSEVKPGDYVTAGQRLAIITDPFGSVRADILSPHAGEVWALRTFATVYANEYVAWVSDIADQELPPSNGSGR